MVNAFGGFNTTSPLSSHSHDPFLDLSSNCIRDYFGPTVQAVSDCIESRGTHSTLAQILQKVRAQCKRVVNSERERLVASLPPLFEGRTRAKLNMARGSEECGFVVDASIVRAALIVLLQHSIVRAIPPTKPTAEDAAAITGGGNTKSATANSDVGNNNTNEKSNGAAAASSSPGNKGKKDMQYRYVIDFERAMLLPRYPRYVEYTRKAFQEKAAAIVEELLVKGRMTTLEVVESAVECVKRYLALNSGGDKNLTADDNAVTSAEDHGNVNGNNKIDTIKNDTNIKSEDQTPTATTGDNDEDDDGSVEMSQEEKLELYQGVLQSFKQLVDGGFVEMVTPIVDEDYLDNGEKEHEFEWEPEKIAQKKLSGNKRRHNDMEDGNNNNMKDPPLKDEIENTFLNGKKQHPQTVKDMLEGNPYKRTFPPGAVWRTNIKMFHASLRAFCLGRLVAERYGHEVQAAGSIVTAALKFAAHKEFAPKPNHAVISSEEKQRLIEEKGIFTPDDMMEFLPPAVLHTLKNKAGGARSNLSASLLALAQFTYPQVVMEVEEARGHASGGKFEITTRQLVEHLRGRILHQIIKDHHGEVAARVCSILEAKGFLESDAIADAAMVPAKDVREILHQLYKANYITLMNLQQTKQHNPNTAIYLWSVSKQCMYGTVLNNICRAFYNLRLRRQHEILVGKDWIERAKESGATDENDSELDKINYNKFCQGLERLDNACLQLDETLMVLKDFL